MATMDEERWLALERDYRRQVNKVYYRRESDFDTLKAYNDYLEEVEEIVEGLVNEKTRPAARAKLDKLKAADPALTARNRALFEEERMAMSLGVERERREAQQRAQQRLHQAQTEAEEQARVKAALQDEVAAGKSVSEAQAELLQRPALATKAAHHASTTNQGYSYKPMSVVQAQLANEARAQPLHEHKDEGPKFLQPSVLLVREAYEDIPEELEAVCRAGGHQQQIWNDRYTHEAFDVSGLWLNIP